MKIATWNVNAIRARLERVVNWLRLQQVDVACFQETKVEDANFPLSEMEYAGYRVVFTGQKAYNGVAIVSREPLEDVVHGLPGDPGDDEKRVIAATVAGIRFINVYVPNGQRVDSDKYEYKLRWLDRLQDFIREQDPSRPLVVCGDFNIAPDDRDVFDPGVWRGKVLTTEPERERFGELLALGLSDALRLLHEEPEIYTWWDYRMGGFRRNLGLRIDHFLVSKPVAGRVRKVFVDREERAGEKPSDHAPLLAVLDPE